MFNVLLLSAFFLSSSAQADSSACTVLVERSTPPELVQILTNNRYEPRYDSGSYYLDFNVNGDYYPDTRGCPGDHFTGAANVILVQKGDLNRPHILKGQGSASQTTGCVQDTNFLGMDRNLDFQNKLIKLKSRLWKKAVREFKRSIVKCK